MRLCMDTNRFEMRAGQTLQLRDGKGTHVEILSGEVWVTQQGDRRDPIIATGGEFDVERDGLTLLHAFQPSLVFVRDPVRKSAGMPALRKFGERLMRYFVEVGMQRSAWRRAYRL